MVSHPDFAEYSKEQIERECLRRRYRAVSSASRISEPGEHPTVGAPQSLNSPKSVRRNRGTSSRRSASESCGSWFPGLLPARCS